MTEEKKQLPITLSDLDKDRWIKTPVAYAEHGATLNKMQQDVMFMVSKKMQGYIDQFLNGGDTDGTGIAIPASVFDDAGKLKVVLRMSDITEAYAYKQLEDAVNDLYNLRVIVKNVKQISDKNGELKFDKKGNPVLKPMNIVIPMFDMIVFPEYGKEYKKRNAHDGSVQIVDSMKTGTIELTINSKVIATVFDMNHGYVEHLARIAKYSNKDATAKLYIQLKMRMYQRKSTHIRLSPVELKKLTGSMVFDLKTGELKKEDYPKWSEYLRWVIEPAKKDLERLCLENNSEFSFEYHCVYNNGRGRGVPDYVEFTLHASRLGIAHKQNKGKSQGVIMQSLFENEPLTMKEQDRRNWLAVVKAFNGRGGLKPLLRRATFVDARNVKDDRGVVRHLFAISMCQEDHAKMNEPKVMADYEKFLKKIKEMFGTKYYPALYIFKSK